MSQKLVLIGASTGGPGHIKKLLSGLNLGLATVVVAQHMNKMFIPSFTSQIGKETGLLSELLSERGILKTGVVYVCDKNFEITHSLPLSAKPNTDIVTTYTPNVDVLFHSAVEISRSLKTMAILLTGIGDDGARGLSQLQKVGARCIAESEESAIVYGMPKRAKELNPNIKSLNLIGIKQELEEFLNAL